MATSPSVIRLLIKLAGSPLEGVTLPEGWVTEGGDGMATYTGAIELRRLSMEWSRGPSGGTTEDRDVCTFHFLNLTGGSPDSSWATADYTQVETAADAFWTAIQARYPTTTALIRYRWHRAGPAFDGPDAPYNPSVRDTARNVAGTMTSVSVPNMLPPQVAFSVTERTDESHSAWGRFYLPAMGANVIDYTGRVNTSICDEIRAAAVTFYNSCRGGNNLFPVIYHRALPERTTKRGETLPARAAYAHSVDSIQVDNLPDVIRSRRYDGPTYRTTVALT